jgi:hypothetical protein
MKTITTSSTSKKNSGIGPLANLFPDMLFDDFLKMKKSFEVSSNFFY